ncbi:hypothetical protein PZA11_004410 [Diplocarpon coronariae]
MRQKLPDTLSRPTINKYLTIGTVLRDIGRTWFLMDPQARQKTTSPTLRAPQACQEIDCLSMKEEIFGTIVIADTSKREGEVLALADDTESSLYASVPTKSIDRAIRFAKVTGR